MYGRYWVIPLLLTQFKPVPLVLKVETLIVAEVKAVTVIPSATAKFACSTEDGIVRITVGKFTKNSVLVPS